MKEKTYTEKGKAACNPFVSKRGISTKEKRAFVYEGIQEERKITATYT